MPVTVNVNSLSVAHQGSNGTYIAFPDVCKTPSPGGPVPIPYPNIAQTSDLTSGTSTIKVDGNPVMIKSSKISTSTGDEAGSALGVVSNKIKGQAQAVSYSFDVKFEGDNVVRLTDPAQQNLGSANTFGPALLQAPLVVLPFDLKGCKAAQKEQKKQEKTHPEEKGKCSAGWNDSGVWVRHQKAMQKIADKMQLVIYLRNGNWHCVNKGWIPGQHQPKPHDVIKANTIKESNVADVIKWLASKDAAAERLAHPRTKPPFPLSDNAMDLFGVVMSKESGEVGMPMRAQKNKRDSNGYKYTGKWITGDYDLQDIMRHDQPGCVRLAGEDWNAFKREANKMMKWDGIQHGPQQAWVAVTGQTDEEGVVHEGASFSMPNKITKYLQQCAAEGAGNVEVPQVRITPKAGKQTRYLPVIDKNLTIVSPKKAPLATDSDKEAANALLCYGCHELPLVEKDEKKEKKK